MTYTEDPSRQRTTVAMPPPVSGSVPVAMEAPVVVAPAPVVPAPVVMERQVHVASSTQYAPDAVIAAVVGLVLLVVGLIVVVRAGVSGPLSSPVVTVLGFRHTATLGILEAAIGLCLLASGAARARGAELFFGLVLGVAGVVGAVQATSFRTSLALQSSMAWLCVLAAAVVVLAALLLPRMARRASVVHQRQA